MIGEYSLKFGPASSVSIIFEEYRCEYLAKTGIWRDLKTVLGTKGAILRVNKIEHEMSADTTYTHPEVTVYLDVRKLPENYPYINYDPSAFLGRYFIKALPYLPDTRRQWQIKLDGHIAGPAKISELKAVLGFGGILQDITIEANPLSMYSNTICLRFVQSRLDELARRKEAKQNQFMNLNPESSWAKSWPQTYAYVAAHAIAKNNWAQVVDDRKPMINYWRRPDLAKDEHSMDAFKYLAECLPYVMTANQAREALGMPKVEDDKFIVKNIKEDNDMYRPSDEFCMKQLGIKEVCDLRIKKVIFNKPATIILWEDGTKTVVKCQPGDRYDKEKGFAFALMKKIYGSGFNDVIKYWCN